jgi:hypothetical protein
VKRQALQRPLLTQKHLVFLAHPSDFFIGGGRRGKWQRRCFLGLYRIIAGSASAASYVGHAYNVYELRSLVLRPGFQKGLHEIIARCSLVCFVSRNLQSEEHMLPNRSVLLWTGKWTLNRFSHFLFDTFSAARRCHHAVTVHRGPWLCCPYRGCSVGRGQGRAARQSRSTEKGMVALPEACLFNGRMYHERISFGMEQNNEQAIGGLSSGAC